VTQEFVEHPRCRRKAYDNILRIDKGFTNHQTLKQEQGYGDW